MVCFKNFIHVCFFSFFLLMGCASKQVYKTIALEEKLHPIPIEQVKVLNRGMTITENFQIIGKVTVNCNTGISYKDALPLVKKTASQAGADGVIDLHVNAGCQWRYDAGLHWNGLMVKWLPPNAHPKRLDKKFLISLSTIEGQAPTITDDPGSSVNIWNPPGSGPLENTLTFKGYYLLPDCNIDSIDANNKKLNSCEKTQLLLKTSVLSDSTKKSIEPSSGAFTTIYVTSIGNITDTTPGRMREVEVSVDVIDKASGKIILNRETTGQAGGIRISDAKMKAVAGALNDLPKVGETPPE